MGNFIYNFKIRSAICLSMVLVLMFLCFTRVLTVMSDSKTVMASSNTVEVEIDSGRGNIFDRNGQKLTAGEKYFAIVFLPNNSAIIRFVRETTGEERKKGLKTLRLNKPTVIYRNQPITGSGIFCFEAFKRYSDDLYLGQLIGYTDLKDNGVYGLEKSFNDILFSKNKKTATFSVSASGEYLLGEKPAISKGNAVGDVYLTIDKKIQQICVDATNNLKKGAVVVSEISSGKIVGLLSKPGLSADSLALAIESNDAPFLNRALNAYSVGSVFKPVVAAAMLENSKDDFCYTCNGRSTILGINFFCNNRNGHGKLGLKEALAFSCNTYFYNAANTVEPKSLHNLSVSLGFGNSVDLTNGISASAGRLTSLSELERSKANIANFAIGQGNIALSPLVLCNLYSSIANDGFYYTPSLIEGYTKNDKYSASDANKKVVAFSKSTAATLKEYLINALYTGTGKNGKPSFGGAGGKTATAQTGQYKNNKEILNAWFCGFFPAENPKYTMVVFCEDAKSGSSDSAPIFKSIADKILLKGDK